MRGGDEGSGGGVDGRRECRRRQKRRVGAGDADGERRRYGRQTWRAGARGGASVRQSSLLLSGFLEIIVPRCVQCFPVQQDQNARVWVGTSAPRFWSAVLSRTVTAASPLVKHIMAARTGVMACDLQRTTACLVQERTHPTSHTCGGLPSLLRAPAPVSSPLPCVCLSLTWVRARGCPRASRRRLPHGRPFPPRGDAPGGDAARQPPRHDAPD